jgi:tRNA(adenine34) deaminase
MDFEQLMHRATQIAAQSGADVPVGALVVDATGEIIASAHNQKESDSDPSAHAEILAIRRAGEALGSWRLTEMTLIVTLEPCVMCAGAIVAARVPRVVFGAFDEKVGAAGSLYDLLRDARLGKPVEVIAGVLEATCQAQLKEYFSSHRALD